MLSSLKEEDIEDDDIAISPKFLNALIDKHPPSKKTSSIKNGCNFNDVSQQLCKRSSKMKSHSDSRESLPDIIESRPQNKLAPDDNSLLGEILECKETMLERERNRDELLYIVLLAAKDDSDSPNPPRAEQEILYSTDRSADVSSNMLDEHLPLSLIEIRHSKAAEGKNSSLVPVVSPARVASLVPMTFPIPRTLTTIKSTFQQYILK